MNNITCVLCGDECQPDLDPDIIYTHNPRTFRLAWMHRFCLENELESAKETPSKSIEYESRYDEWLSKY